MRELPDMMTASEGGHGKANILHSKGGCMNLILQISANRRQGGVKKSENFAGVINGCSLT